VVIAAGLSPAWQQVLVFDAFEPGAVNRAREAYWCASGKVLNVGLALHFVSEGSSTPTLSLSTLGGEAYEPIEREFRTIGALHRWIRTASPTRVCTTLVDAANNCTTELVENAGPITANELHEFEQAFAELATQATAIVLTGSLPEGAPVSFYRDLLSHAKAPVICDFRGPELLEALETNPFLVKPNRQELAHTLGRPLNTDEDLHLAMRELQRCGAQSVLITSGPDAAWLASDNAMHRLTPPRADKIINPIGCGDCRAAALAWSLAQGTDLLTATEAGLSLAAKNLQTLLPADLDGRRAQLSSRPGQSGANPPTSIKK
jgi:1-phosphofructokinase family hexose kinase